MFCIISQIAFPKDASYFLSWPKNIEANIYSIFIFF